MIFIDKRSETVFGFNTWQELERQLQCDLPRMIVRVNGTRVKTENELWHVNRMKPFSRQVLETFTQNVFAPGLEFINTLIPHEKKYFVQSPDQHHTIDLDTMTSTTTAVTHQSLIECETMQPVAHYQITTMLDKNFITIEVFQEQ